MDPVDTILKWVGVWGGLLSSILAVVAFVGSRRRIRAELVPELKRSVVKLKVVNVGQRPVTVERVSITIDGREIQSSETLAAGSRINLPKPLSDGQAVDLQFTEQVCADLLACHLQADVVVHLADGRRQFRFRARPQ